MNLPSLLTYSSAALAAVLALGGALRARRAVERWAFAAGMAALALERTFSGLMAGAPSPMSAYNWQLWRLTAVALIPGTWLLFSLGYARGNAREFLRRWRLVLGAAFLIPLGAAVLYRPALVVSTSNGPDDTLLRFNLGPAGTTLFLVQLIAAVLVLVNLERTFRAAVGIVRWRIKYFLMGVGVLFLVRLYTASQALLFRSIDPSLDILNSGALLIAGLLILRSLFRAGHFNLEVYPSHTVLQGSVTILLVGSYLLIVGVLAKIVTYLGGDSSFAFKTLVVLVVLVVLAVLLQSDRVRMQIRQFVSRHFQRPLHDYGTVWRKFTEGTASRVEQSEYNRAVVTLTADIFQTLSVTLWMLDDGREDLVPAATTSLTASQMQSLRPTTQETATVISHFHSHPEPVDFEKLPDAWAEILRRLHPDEFHKGGTRVGVPITAGGEVLGMILLGDRVGGTSFTQQDLDLLKSIGGQVASGLLNARLSQRLLQAREHEAFQTMATFFVHDLKNAASTLNLMLQNLPTHFDDPAFREDALRGVGKSVAHINHLISRLGELRQELKIHAVESDLNELVGSVLAAYQNDPAFVIETELAPLPKLALDREQFSKVLTNLVLNARDASNGQGRLRIRTARAGGWAVLTTADDGCGMSEEFQARSLFRPFQTTKKNGLGIGMFQSKMIVEAHGGRIEVESAPGKGATFRVFLPVSPGVR